MSQNILITYYIQYNFQEDATECGTKDLTEVNTTANSRNDDSSHF